MRSLVFTCLLLSGCLSQCPGRYQPAPLMGNAELADLQRRALDGDNFAIFMLVTHIQRLEAERGH